MTLQPIDYTDIPPKLEDDYLYFYLAITLEPISSLKKSELDDLLNIIKHFIGFISIENIEITNSEIYKHPNRNRGVVYCRVPITMFKYSYLCVIKSGNTPEEYFTSIIIRPIDWLLCTESNDPDYIDNKLKFNEGDYILYLDKSLLINTDYDFYSLCKHLMERLDDLYKNDLDKVSIIEH